MKTIPPWYKISIWYSAFAMNIDIKARNMQAAAITEELTSHEVPPLFMWRPIAAPLAEEAEALRSSLESAISSNAAQGRVKEVLAGIPALERDIAKAVLQMATSPGYFEIPDSLLGVPSKSSRVFSALPNLAERLDEPGLLHLAGLRATPRAVFIDTCCGWVGRMAYSCAPQLTSVGSGFPSTTASGSSGTTGTVRR